jgi:hypothetical protein
MEAFLRVFPFVNILLYVIAFAVAYNRAHNFTAYIVLLIIQLVVFVMQAKKVGYTGGGDAAGNGMEAGFLYLIYEGVQIIVFIILLIVFFRKVF